MLGVKTLKSKQVRYHYVRIHFEADVKFLFVTQKTVPKSTAHHDVVNLILYLYFVS